jgi:hypothetical protein
MTKTRRALRNSAGLDQGSAQDRKGRRGIYLSQIIVCANS